MINFQDRYLTFNRNIDIISFYKNFKNTEFNNIKVKKLIELKEIAKKVNSYYTAENEYSKKSKYIRLMNKIKTNPKGYNIENDLEKYILFMFIVDPNYEATYMFAGANKIEEIIVDMAKKFGVYDPNLILIEKYFIKNILGPKSRKKIEDKVLELSYR